MSAPLAPYGYAGASIGYDAVQGKGRRKMPTVTTFSEDFVLREQQRKLLSATHRDLNRNFSIVAWAVRQHLDYVSTFTFRSKNGNGEDPAFDKLDDDIEALMYQWSLPENCDMAGRHRLERLVRLWELCRVLDGDVLLNLLEDATIQTVESDRVQNGPGVDYAATGITDPQNVVNGVYVDDRTRAKAFVVFKRPTNGGGLQFDRLLPATFAWLFGYYDRYDQVRGISPLASAANSFRDIYENLDYAQIKSKVAQLMAFVFTREGSESFQESYGGEQGQQGQQEAAKREPYDLDLGKGPAVLDLDRGDDAKVIESKTPSTEFQAFIPLTAQIALKALDIPFSFFDESHTNYSGARLAGINYEKSATIKREDNRENLNRITRWRLSLAVANGEIKLPKGFTVDQLNWEWAHTGTPWYDPVKEVAGAVAACNAALSSEIREGKKLGVDVFQMIDERAQVQEYARSKGVTLSTDLIPWPQSRPQMRNPPPPKRLSNERPDPH
jgi:capsid protein